MPGNSGATARALRALGGHHGVGSQPGQPADRWASSYFALMHRHLGISPPAGAGRFLLEGMGDGTCQMHDSEGPSMWSNWLSAEAIVSAYGAEVPAPDLSVEYVVASQSDSGGIGWGPAWAEAGMTELRAGSFALRWMAVIGRFERTVADIDRDALIAWILALQDSSGGFRLQPEAATPCLWATAEAVDLLHQLDFHAPEVTGAAADFALDNLMSDGGFRRCAAYDHSDLWSTRNGTHGLFRCSTRARRRRRGRHLPRCMRGPRRGCHLPARGPGRRVHNGGGLAGGNQDHPEEAVEFLHHLRMPEDGGIAYMPGRAPGASLRLAGLAAAKHGRPLDTAPSIAWARSARNPDGGWGVFEGRSSSTNTTCAVLAAAEAAGEVASVVSPELVRWVRRRWLAARHVPARPCGAEPPNVDLEFRGDDSSRGAPASHARSPRG